MALSTCPVERPRPCPRPRPAFLSSSVVGHRCRWISSTDWFTNWDEQWGHVAGSLSGMEQSRLLGWWGSCNDRATAKFSLLTGSHSTKNERDNCPVYILALSWIFLQEEEKNVNKKWNTVQNLTHFWNVARAYLLRYQAFFLFSWTLEACLEETASKTSWQTDSLVQLWR